MGLKSENAWDDGGCGFTRYSPGISRMSSRGMAKPAVERLKTSKSTVDTAYITPLHSMCNGEYARPRNALKKRESCAVLYSSGEIERNTGPESGRVTSPCRGSLIACQPGTRRSG
jgi:hypothetical protein